MWLPGPHSRQLTWASGSCPLSLSGAFSLSGAASPLGSGAGGGEVLSAGASASSLSSDCSPASSLVPSAGLSSSSWTQSDPSQRTVRASGGQDRLSDARPWLCSEGAHSLGTEDTCVEVGCWSSSPVRQEGPGNEGRALDPEHRDSSAAEMGMVTPCQLRGQANC